LDLGIVFAGIGKINWIEEEIFREEFGIVSGAKLIKLGIAAKD
jgi:hypothetical protein